MKFLMIFLMFAWLLLSGPSLDDNPRIDLEPHAVEVCAVSGMIAHSGCPVKIIKTFYGNYMMQACTYHPQEDPRILGEESGKRK